MLKPIPRGRAGGRRLLRELFVAVVTGDLSLSCQAWYGFENCLEGSSSPKQLAHCTALFFFLPTASSSLHLFDRRVLPPGVRWDLEEEEGIEN